jgi:hypothetical protein
LVSTARSRSVICNVVCIPFFVLFILKKPVDFEKKKKKNDSDTSTPLVRSCLFSSPLDANGVHAVIMWHSGDHILRHFKLRRPDPHSLATDSASQRAGNIFPLQTAPWRCSHRQLLAAPSPSTLPSLTRSPIYYTKEASKQGAASEIAEEQERCTKQRAPPRTSISCRLQ